VEKHGVPHSIIAFQWGENDRHLFQAMRQSVAEKSNLLA
jgi:hypothetical protein